jgi:hypothetical protein
MDFIKKHYEKVLLGVVLLGLAVAFAWLPFKVTSERAKLRTIQEGYTQSKIKELTNLDLTLPNAALARLAVPAYLDLSSSNKVFNPMPWKKTIDGRLIKFDDTHIGPRAVAVTKTSPLYLILTLDNVSLTENGPRYIVGVENQASNNPNQRRKRQISAALKIKNELFTVQDVKGKPEEPTELVLQMNDTGESALLSKEKPFQRVDGYTADLKYDPENRTWAARRRDQSISLNGEDYKIIAISQNEVVLSAKSNQKNWPIKFNATP